MGLNNGLPIIRERYQSSKHFDNSIVFEMENSEFIKLIWNLDMGYFEREGFNFELYDILRDSEYREHIESFEAYVMEDISTIFISVVGKTGVSNKQEEEHGKREEEQQGEFS